MIRTLWKKTTLVADLGIVNTWNFFNLATDPILMSCVLAVFSKYCAHDSFLFCPFFTEFYFNHI